MTVFILYKCVNMSSWVYWHICLLSSLFNFLSCISCHLSGYMIELYEFIDIWACFFFVSRNMEMPIQLKYNMLHLPAIYNNVLSEPIIFLFYCYFCFSLWNSYSKRIYSMYSNSMSDKLIKAWKNIVYVIGVCVKNENT